MNLYVEVSDVDAPGVDTVSDKRKERVETDYGRESRREGQSEVRTVTEMRVRVKG